MAAAGDAALSDEDRAFWDENGYVIVGEAVPKAHAAAAVEAIFEYLDVDGHRPDDWYRSRFLGGVELYHHQTFWDNRQFPRLYRAFAEIWGRADLWVSIDRANMTTPEHPTGYRWEGALHWDPDTVAIPLPMRIQGVLYLDDTALDQGGFRCVPGFQLRIRGVGGHAACGPFHVAARPDRLGGAADRRGGTGSGDLEQPAAAR